MNHQPLIGVLHRRAALLEELNPVVDGQIVLIAEFINWDALSVRDIAFAARLRAR